MRFAAAAVLALMLAACGVEAAQDTEPAPEEYASTPAGEYKPSSNTARSITGSAVVQPAGITFNNGVVLYTRTLNPRRGGDLIAKNGDSYAAAVLGAANLSVELRRVTEQVVPAGAVGLCGGSRPQYVAMAFDERATAISMLVFGGSEPPGPEATDSWICGSFRYAAPEGARTREGVVL